jgi:hypothetical protein
LGTRDRGQEIRGGRGVESGGLPGMSSLLTYSLTFLLTSSPHHLITLVGDKGQGTRDRKGRRAEKYEWRGLSPISSSPHHLITHLTERT